MNRWQEENAEFLLVLREALLRAHLAYPHLRPADWRRLAEMAGAGSGATYPLKTYDGRWVSFVSIGDGRKWVYDREEGPTRRLIEAGVFRAARESSPRALEVEWFPPR